MNHYILGLATLPALAAALAIAFVVLRGLLWLAAQIPGRLISFAKEPTDQQRARFSSIIYGAKRAKFAVFGEVGIVLIWGMDNELRTKAEHDLTPQPTINPKWLRSDVE